MKIKIVVFWKIWITETYCGLQTWRRIPGSIVIIHQGRTVLVPNTEPSTLKPHSRLERMSQDTGGKSDLRLKPQRESWVEIYVHSKRHQRKEGSRDRESMCKSKLVFVHFLKSRECNHIVFLADLTEVVQLPCVLSWLLQTSLNSWYLLSNPEISNLLCSQHLKGLPFISWCSLAKRNT